MLTPELDDFIRRAETIYEQRLAGLLEPEHRNGFVAIEPESGSCFLGADIDRGDARCTRRVSGSVVTRHARGTQNGITPWRADEMIGRVDEEGRALVTIRMGAAKNALVHEVDVWVDTGFNGDLVLPKVYIDELNLPHAGTAKAVLADGSEVSLKVHLCLIEWFREIRELNVVANDGSNPLLGVGLLIGRDVRVSYRSMTVAIE